MITPKSPIKHLTMCSLSQATARDKQLNSLWTFKMFFGPFRLYYVCVGILKNTQKEEEVYQQMKTFADQTFALCSFIVLLGKHRPQRGGDWRTRVAPVLM